MSPDKTGSSVKVSGLPVGINDQLHIILQINGSLSEEDSCFLTDPKAITYLKAFPYMNRKNLNELFPATSNEALELLS